MQLAALLLMLMLLLRMQLAAFVAADAAAVAHAAGLREFAAAVDARTLVLRLGLNSLLNQ